MKSSVWLLLLSACVAVVLSDKGYYNDDDDSYYGSYLPSYRGRGGYSNSYYSSGDYGGSSGGGGYDQGYGGDYGIDDYGGRGYGGGDNGYEWRLPFGFSLRSRDYGFGYGRRFLRRSFDRLFNGGGRYRGYTRGLMRTGRGLYRSARRLLRGSLRGLRGGYGLNPLLGLLRPAASLKYSVTCDVLGLC